LLDSLLQEIKCDIKQVKDNGETTFSTGGKSATE